jgi:hypothetical protein
MESAQTMEPLQPSEYDEFIQRMKALQSLLPAELPEQLGMKNIEMDLGAVPYLAAVHPSYPGPPSSSHTSHSVHRLSSGSFDSHHNEGSGSSLDYEPARIDRHGNGILHLIKQKKEEDSTRRMYSNSTQSSTNNEPHHDGSRSILELLAKGTARRKSASWTTASSLIGVAGASTTATPAASAIALNKAEPPAIVFVERGKAANIHKSLLYSTIRGFGFASDVNEIQKRLLDGDNIPLPHPLVLTFGVRPLITFPLYYISFFQLVLEENFDGLPLYFYSSFFYSGQVSL